MHPLLCRHPIGDLRTPVCPHWVPEHPNGHQQAKPCVHVRRVQIGGHWEGIRWVPDFQVTHDHENDGFVHVACLHLRQVHPNGNCDFGPCVHPLNPVRRDQRRNIVYYTDNQELQNAVETSYDRLTSLGVSEIGTAQRPLLIFHHAPALDGGQSDPMWSHYDPALHAIQIMQGHPVQEAVFHEIGHAIVAQRCVQVATLGSPHTLDQPTFRGDAMSEGWADFVSCVLRYAANDENAKLGGYILEGTLGNQGREDVELDVARCLWDFYDTTKSRSRVDPRTRRMLLISIPDDEVCSFSFAELYKVFSPSLQTLINGPVIIGIRDYTDRLIANNSAQSRAINGAYARNFG